MSHPTNRRTFLQSTLATGVTGAAALNTFPVFGLPFAPAAPKLPRRSANEELRVAVVGVRSRGGAHINGFHNQENVRVVALCDADRDILAREVKKFADRNETVDGVVDFRDLLDRDDIDIISIATPNHWHALMTVWACEAGKDVYVEKPVSHNVWEGRQMVNAARYYDRIVQTGTQSRSSHAIRDAIAWLREGNLGEILFARGTCYKPRQSIGKVDGPQQPPASVDYDLWCGPASDEPLARRNLHYDWHWVHETGNGDVGNQGIHQMDLCRWALGETGLPPRVASIGGRLGYDDDGNTPNTQVVLLDYEAAPLIFEVRGLPRDKQAQTQNWGGSMDRLDGMSIGAAVHCTEGILTFPNYHQAIARTHDGEEIQRWSGADDHFVNCVAAVRSRDAAALNGPIEDGHVSSALCHLGNISHLLGTPVQPQPLHNLLRMMEETNATSQPMLDAARRMCEHLAANEVDLAATPLTVGAFLEVDPTAEQFRNNDAANTLLTRDYREPFVVPAVG